MIDAVIKSDFDDSNQKQTYKYSYIGICTYLNKVIVLFVGPKQGLWLYSENSY